jgi:phosphopantothenoylcysteine decarboxylase/phosphopantothenate--cysteine ligase
MDLDMFKHPATQKNIEILVSHGNFIIEPADGELASGLFGKGRMEEPEKIISHISDFLKKDKKLISKKVLVTAGPTYEAIDPVRFIGNHSSGKMGYALAEEFADQGAEVILISGPTSINTSNPLVKVINVDTALEMYNACIEQFDKVDIAVMAAAVADYTPAKPSDHKIKRKSGNLTLELKKTNDIAAELGARKREDQFLIGFALETDNEFENAFLKVKSKNLDFVVLNSLKDEGVEFGSDSNKISLIDRNNNIANFKLKSKREVSKDIINKVIDLLQL